MWNEARKSYRSPQKSSSQPQRLSTTCLLTSGKAEKPSCPLHFNEPTHVCLSCRKSICLRCALTYCQQHPIRTEAEVLPSLRQDLFRLQVTPKLQELQVKLRQSKQRQEYLQKKVLRMIEGIESHFEYIAEMLTKKKLQIIQYYDEQFQSFLQQHRAYDQEMRGKVEWLAGLAPDQEGLLTIEEIDQLSAQLKKSTLQEGKLEKKVTRMLMGKDKIRTEKLWSEESLEGVLYEIENIPYRIEERSKNDKRKKRITTENANEHVHTVASVKSNSNSRFPSSRKPHPHTPS